MILLMQMVQTLNDDAVDGGAAMKGDRRPTVVAAPGSSSRELSARPRRRTFTAKDGRGQLNRTCDPAGNLPRRYIPEDRNRPKAVLHGQRRDGLRVAVFGRSALEKADVRSGHRLLAAQPTGVDTKQ